jgi:hypothetical protein
VKEFKEQALKQDIAHFILAPCVILRNVNLPKYCMLQSENQINLFKLGAPPVETILLEDVLGTLTSKTAIMKIDVESLECKVGVKLQ